MGNKKSLASIQWALFFTVLVPWIGYLSFGIWPALLFLTGYLGGFLLWLFIPTKTSFKSIKWIYAATFLLFLVHRVEEKIFGFFKVLSEITGVLIPEIASVPVILLILLSVGAWVIGPILFKKGTKFGSYLIWTFFASMGITELAHFVLPFFKDEPYGYFPGMASVAILAPVSWLGMWRLSKRPQDNTKQKFSAGH